jgi:hypothetical protein
MSAAVKALTGRSTAGTRRSLVALRALAPEGKRIRKQVRLSRRYIPNALRRKSSLLRSICVRALESSR